MHSAFHRIARVACAALCMGLCMACGVTRAAPQARVVSSTWLPGGKYALVYAYDGAEYMALSADPPGGWADAAPAAMPTEAASQARPPVMPQARPQVAQQVAPPPAPPAVVVSRAEVFPESHSYVGGFFIDPLSAALRASGLGLLLGGDWSRGPRGPRHYSR
jgi:hypothetical protein